MFWENERFFDKIWTWEHCGFRKLTFLAKYGYESIDFLVKIGRKKRVPYWLFCYIVLTEWTFLDQLWAWHKGVFHGIFSKMREWTVFWQNMRMRAGVFREWMIFWQNMGMGVEFFSWIIWEKKFFCDFLAHNIYYSFDRIDVFLTKYMHDSGGVFHEKCGKNYMRAQFLWECTFLWRNRGMSVVCFFRERTFFEI